MMHEIDFSGKDKVRAFAEIAAFFETLDNDEEYVLTVKKKKKKRSLNANALAWSLMDKLAAKLKIGKTEIYRNYIREIGGNAELVCVQNKALTAFCDGWQHNGIGWLTDTLPSKLNDCTNVICYFGSSTYNTEQMSRLIDMIIQDCRDNGIATPEDEELDRITLEWIGE